MNTEDVQKQVPELVGHVHLTHDGTSVKVEFRSSTSMFDLASTRLYVGKDVFPIKDGKETLDLPYHHSGKDVQSRDKDVYELVGLFDEDE